MATPDGHVIVAPALLVPMLPSAKVGEVRRPGEYYTGLGGSYGAAFGAGARGPGSLGVGARCGNGPFSTYKSPKFYLSFTILVSFILVKYPDRIGLVNTVPWYRGTGTVGTVP